MDGSELFWRLLYDATQVAKRYCYFASIWLFIGHAFVCFLFDGFKMLYFS